ncbi:MAG TPA: S9 family peptidase [Deltaproteobacteria bacterium]|nr:S9 family peptidase [Deltaproteobacteria bacterium]
MSVALMLWLLGVATAGEAVPGLEQIMAHPDWVARSPYAPGFGLDSRTVWYRRKQAGSDDADWWTVGVRGGEPVQVGDTAREQALAPGGVLRDDGRYRLTTVGGAVWVVDRKEGAHPLTTPNVHARQPGFLTDGRVAWRQHNTWLAAALDGIDPTPLVTLVLEDDPADASPDSFLEAQQLRLFPSLARSQAERERHRTESTERALRDDFVSREVFFGDGRELVDQSLSPDGAWLLVVDRPKPATPERDPMPAFVTASGYVETSELRPKVGTGAREDVSVWLVPVDQGDPISVALDRLPGRSEDPLAHIRAEPLPDDRPLRPVTLYRHAWTDSGSQLALQLHSIDDKDRWTVVVDLSTVDRTERASAHTPTVVDHLHDPAWIAWPFNHLAWLPDDTLWFQSEASGYAHLYRWDGANTQALTEGRWEVYDPAATADGRWIYFSGNVERPGHYEVYRVPTAGGPIEAVTALGGVNDFRLSPDDRSIVIEHSEVLRPPELYVQAARPGAPARQLTDTIEPTWAAIDWMVPEILPIPSTHTEAPIWSRVYRPTEPPPQGGRPAVVFVHGAGYLQNSHEGWSAYFREMMFHSLLVEQGYVVLDMDYRASRGYGRDWRTAIYRQMGHPELQDLADGITWLTENAHVDPARVGIYGGSYGGFITFMALFKQPELWAAGAALRPVTDWSNYNDGYTRAILNTPEVDPEAYRRSSPIEHAEGLEDPLLICHGMVDSNVPYQDSVRLAQRLIELRKTGWELASYPIEGHGFTEPASWLDEYRRIYALFERTIGRVPTPLAPKPDGT